MSAPKRKLAAYTFAEATIDLIDTAIPAGQRSQWVEALILDAIRDMRVTLPAPDTEHALIQDLYGLIKQYTATTTEK